MVKIALIGPESTGKTTLCEQLSRYFGCRWVAEYAREYVEALTEKYTYSDVEAIAKMQVQQMQACDEGEGVVLFDTDLIITRVWFLHCFGQEPEWMEQAIRNEHVALYLLCKPDLQWEEDVVRENPHIREALYERYAAEVRRLGVPYVEISGTGQGRVECAIAAVKNFMQKTV